MIIPDYRSVPKLECRKIQLFQIYTRMVISFYIFCQNFIKIGKLFSEIIRSQARHSIYSNLISVEISRNEPKMLIFLTNFPIKNGDI